ncbi:MAG: glycosyltransferase family 39 protein [Patescibacteria group bacterium]|nr:glycosyltransferase family 39 protein [Patescibacteria group bacterium]
MTRREHTIEKLYGIFSALNRRLTFRAAIYVFCAVGLVTYINACFNGFVLDDIGQIVTNPTVRSLGNIPGLFFGRFHGHEVGLYYRPMMLSSFVFLYSIFHDHAFFFHFIQVNLHILNAILAYGIFRRFFDKGVAFFLGLLFLVHPVNEETVVYISNLQDVLFMLFGLLSFSYLTKSMLQRKDVIYSSLFLLLALFSKETAILFLAVGAAFLLINKSKQLIPYLAYSSSSVAIYAFMRFISGTPLQKAATIPIMALSFGERMMNAPAIIYYYVKTFFYPINLVTMQSWTIAGTQFIDFYFPLLVDAAVCVGLVAACRYLVGKGEGRRMAFFFLLWLALGLLMHLQIIPIDCTVADRYFYFPFIGLLGMVGVFFQSLRLKKTGIVACVIIGSILLAVLSARTIVRNMDWKSQTTILAHDVKVADGNYLLELLYGADLLKNNEFGEAEGHIRKAVTLYPESAIAWSSVGAFNYLKGDYAQAKEAYRHSIAIGGYLGAYENMAKLLYEHGDIEEARAFTVKATALYPNSESLWYRRLLIGYKMGNHDEQLLSSRNCYLVSGNTQYLAAYNQLLKGLPIRIQE